MPHLPDTNTTENPYLKLPFVTIDSESTRDIDDALYVEKLDTGYRVISAIANPVSLVQIGSTEDEQAKLMAATAYVRDTAVRRMLPPKISEHLGSLVAGQVRKAVIFDLRLSESLEVSACTIHTGPIKVAARLSHADIPAIIGDASHPCQAMLSLASTLGRLLLDRRRQRGALALYDLSRLILTDEEGKLQILHSVEEVIGYIIVQEMMILTNRAAATWMIERDIPCLFRNHEPRLAAPRADELALTLEGWVRGAAFDIDAVRDQFTAIAGKARYGASTLGHYGLSLPSYLHISSPLRRYADLVNMRQLVAHLKERPLPYTKDALATLAEDLNAALERRKEERSEHFKDVVRRNAEAAMEDGRLMKLADHELRQALKLGKSAGYLPDSLATEVARRFSSATATEILGNSLLTEIPHELMDDGLRSALAGWLSDMPSRGVQLIHHGQQTGMFVEYSCTGAEAAQGFSAQASLLDAQGNRYTGFGSGPRKRDAEQSAALIVLFRAFGLPVPEVDPVAVAPAIIAPMQSDSRKNPKGQLLELCQKQKWPMPEFAIIGKGPSHKMIFSGTATMTLNGVEYRGEVSHAATKKDAEAVAAGILLDKVSGLVSAQPSAPPVSAGSNPVGALQEMAQKGGYQMPAYELVQVRENPPHFRCTVTTFGPDSRRFTGEGENKQKAKAQAASAAVSALR